MKNKVLTLKDKTQLYIVDEITYKNHRYIYGMQCDNKAGTISNTHMVLEANINQGKLVIDNINDFATASVINNIFISRSMKENIMA